MQTDNEIRKNVVDEIQWDPQLTRIAPQIGVIVKNEVVTLSGAVDYYGQKVAAEKAAKRVKDVKVVAMDDVEGGSHATPKQFQVKAGVKKNLCSAAPMRRS